MQSGRFFLGSRRRSANIRAMPDLTASATAFQFAQGALVLLGLGLLAGWFFAPKIQPWRRAEPCMPRWEASLGDTLLAAWVAVCAALVGSLFAGSVARQLSLTSEDGWLSVVSVLGFQGAIIAALAGFALYRRVAGRPLPACGIRPSAPFTDRLLLGAATFCVALPFVYGASFLSAQAMELLGLPVKLQDLANLFATTDSPPLLFALTFMAIVVAPLGEEVLFRAGFFRIARRFLPRWLAVLLSAVAFASLHLSAIHFVPLVVLGIVFALAYERSGSLLVPVVAHGLFNLNSILMLLTGAGSPS